MRFSIIVKYLLLVYTISVLNLVAVDSTCKTLDLDQVQFYNTTNRTKRQVYSVSIIPWRRIYSFTKRFAKIVGNNALLSNVNDMLNTKSGGVSKAYTYGYRGGYGGGYGRGYGGGYGGYSYAAPPIVYYIPVQTQSAFPFNSIFGLASAFGNTLGNTDLLDTLINLIQVALDSGGGDGTGK